MTIEFAPAARKLRTEPVTTVHACWSDAMPVEYPSPLQVLVLTASLRRDSLNGRLATLAADVVARHGVTVDRRQLGEFDSPSYDQDVEVELGVPEPANEFCQRLKHADAFVIASPEYNASIPGGLKNLIDWTSRLRPQPFNGKQCLLMSASPSMAGGNRPLGGSHPSRAFGKSRLSGYVLAGAGP